MKRSLIFGIVFFVSFISTCYAAQLAVIKTSGVVFKDKLKVLAFDDPDIKGITCYVTLPSRALSFTDQTDSAISCRQTGIIQGNIVSKSRIFKNKKGIFVKSLFVDRVYDKKRNVLIYVSYTSKMSGDNANNSVSVVTIK
jgi:CreA protein